MALTPQDIAPSVSGPQLKHDVCLSLLTPLNAIAVARKQ